MQRYATIALISMFAILLFVPSALGRQIIMKPNLIGGQEFPYSLGLQVYVSQRQGEAAATITQMVCGAKVNIKVGEVSNDGSIKGQATINEAFVELAEGQPDQKWEWPVQVPIADDAPAFKKLGGVIAAAKIDFAVDPDGKVVVTGGLEDFTTAVGNLEARDNRAAGFFTPEQFATMIEPIFRVDDARKAQRETGKGWQSTDQVMLPPAGALQFTTDYRVYESDPDTARYTGKVNIAVLQPADKGEDVPTVTLAGETGGVIEGQWDRQLVMLRRRKINYVIDSTWRLGDQVLEQRQTSIYAIRLLDGRDGK